MNPIEPEKLKEILDLHGKWLRGEVGGVQADLRSANLQFADLQSADLQFADLQSADITGEPWQNYISTVVPALLTAGGKSINEVAEAWDCHDWSNCPMAVAFGIHSSAEAPLLLRPRVEQFVQLFDAGLIPKPVVTSTAVLEGRDE